VLRTGIEWRCPILSHYQVERKERTYSTTPIAITDVASAACNTFKCLPRSALTHLILWLGYGLDERSVVFEWYSKQNTVCISKCRLFWGPHTGSTIVGSGPGKNILGPQTRADQLKNFTLNRKACQLQSVLGVVWKFWFVLSKNNYSNENNKHMPHSRA